MKIDVYTKVVLTGILGCLLWLCATLTPIGTPVQAQLGPTPVVIAGFQEGGQVLALSSARGLPVSEVTGTAGATSTTALPPASGAAPPAAMPATTVERPALSPAPAQSPASQPATRQQCAATTKKGTRCSRMANAGSAYCWQHGG
jgi:putative hemolysin